MRRLQFIECRGKRKKYVHIEAMAIKRNITVSCHMQILNWRYGAVFYNRQMMIMVKYLQKSTTSPSFDVSGTVCPAADIPPEMLTATTVGGASNSGRNPTRRKRQPLRIISSQNFSSFVIRSQWHDRCVHTTESPYTCPQTTSWHCTW